MELQRCKTCKYFDCYYSSCGYWYEEEYLDGSDFSFKPVLIRDVDKDECKYERI